MERDQDPLRLTHMQPKFWQFAGAYILIGAGSVMVALQLMELALLGDKKDLFTGLIFIWFGTLSLGILARSARGRVSEEPMQADEQDEKRG